MPVVEIELKSADRPRVSIAKPPQSRPKKPSDPDLMDSDSMHSVSSETADGRPQGTGITLNCKTIQAIFGAFEFLPLQE